jgi:dienelactone hydrolase
MIALAAALVAGGCTTLRAARLVSDTMRPPEELAEAVTEHVETVAREGGDSVALMIVQPHDDVGPRPAFLLVHGAHVDGWGHPALVALARGLARRGATAAILDLAALRELRIDARDVERIRDAAIWLADRSDLAEDGRVALFGISVGGSYAIAAAAAPVLAERVSCVFAFGAYPDLDALLLRLLAAPPPAAGGLLDPLGEGRRRLLLGNVEALVPPGDRTYVVAVLEALLAGDEPPPDAVGLSAASRAVVDAARSRAPLPQDKAQNLLARIASENAALSPARLVRTPRAPVYLLHGANDPLVPASEAVVLRDALAARGATVRLLVTDLYSHVDPVGDSGPSLWRAWPLLRIVGAAISDAGL